MIAPLLRPAAGVTGLVGDALATVGHVAPRPRPTALTVSFVGVALALLGGLVYVAPLASLGLFLVGAAAIPLSRGIWRRPEVGLVALTFLTAGLISHSSLTFPFGGGRLNATDLVLLGTLAVFTVAGLRRNALVVPRWSILGPLAAFAGVVGFSALYALVLQRVPGGLVVGEARPAAYCAGCAFGVALLARRGQVALLLAGLFLVADLTAGAMLLQQFISAQRFLALLPDWQVNEMGSPGGGLGVVRVVPPAHVLMFLMANIAFCLALGPLRRAWQRIFLLLQVALLGGGLLLTYTRAQWVASGVALVLACALLPLSAKRRLARATLIALPILMLLAGLVGTGVLPVAETSAGQALAARATSILAPDQTLNSASLEWRVFEVRAAASALSQHPLLGVGVGNDYRGVTLLQGEASGVLWPLDGSKGRLTRWVHDSYLYMAVKMGLPGIAAFLWFSVAFLVGGMRAYLDAPDGAEKLVVLAVLCSFAGLLEWAVFEAHFMLPAGMATLGLMVGMIARAGAYRPAAETPRTPRATALSASRLAPTITPPTHPRMRRPMDSPPALARDQGVRAAAPPSFRRGLVFTSSGSIANLVLLFLETIIAARLLPPSAYGAYILLLTAVNFLVMAVDFGCKVSVTQLLASSDRPRQEVVIGSALAFRVCALALASALLLLLRGALTTFDPASPLPQYLGYAPLMLATASLEELFFAMLQGFQAYQRMATAQIARCLGRLVLTVVLLGPLHAGVAALVYSWSLSFAVAIGYEFWSLPVRSVWRWQWMALAAILRFGLPLQVTRFLAFFSARLHVSLLGALVGPSAVAFFAIAGRMPDGLQTVSDSFFRVYFPTMSSLLSAGHHDSAEAMLRRSLRLIAFAGSVAAIVAVVFSREIVTLLFSAKYASSAPVFALLMLALQMSVLVSVLGYTMTASGRPGRSLQLGMAVTAVGAVADLLLIPHLGLVGAACAAIAASYLSSPLAVWLVRRGRLAVDVAPFTKQILILLVCAALGWWLHPANLVVAVTAKAAILALFVVLSLLFSTVSREDFALVIGGRAQRPAAGDQASSPPRPAVAEGG